MFNSLLGSIISEQFIYLFFKKRRKESKKEKKKDKFLYKNDCGNINCFSAIFPSTVFFSRLNYSFPLAIICRERGISHGSFATPSSPFDRKVLKRYKNPASRWNFSSVLFRRLHIDFFPFFWWKCWIMSSQQGHYLFVLLFAVCPTGFIYNCKNLV